MMTVGAGVDPFVPASVRGFSPPFLFAIVVVGDPVFSLCRRSREFVLAGRFGLGGRRRHDRRLGWPLHIGDVFARRHVWLERCGVRDR